MGTLLLQGITLSAVVRVLRIPPDDATRDTLVEAATQHAASRAALEALERHAGDAPSEVVDQLRSLTERRANAAWERLGRGRETPSKAYIRLRRHMLLAEREVFREARDAGRIPEEVLVRAQRELDLEESMLERRHPE
jgi:CPA1 family monovalent cation:H+ antiporter